MADTKISALTGADAAAFRARTIATNAGLGETLAFPDTTDATAKYGQAVDWIIETGYTDFPSQTYADPVMCLGYNVDYGAGRKDVTEPGVGLFIESDYYNASAPGVEKRFSEIYFQHYGGSTDNYNRPLFFQWERETGVLMSSQVHAAGASGVTGFKVIAPTGGNGESGSILWNAYRNNLDGYCHDTAAACVLTLGVSGAAGVPGTINLRRGNTLAAALSPHSATGLTLSLAGVEGYYFQKGASSTGWCFAIGTSSNGAQILQDMAISPNAQIGHRIIQKSTGTGNLAEYTTSTGTVNYAVDVNFNVIPKAGAASQTQGFICVTSGAGAAGTPATLPSGTAPMFVDTSGSRVGFYFGGSWKYAALA